MEARRVRKLPNYQFLGAFAYWLFRVDCSDVDQLGPNVQNALHRPCRNAKVLPIIKQTVSANNTRGVSRSIFVQRWGIQEIRSIHRLTAGIFTGIEYVGWEFSGTPHLRFCKQIFTRLNFGSVGSYQITPTAPDTLGSPFYPNSNGLRGEDGSNGPEIGHFMGCNRTGSLMQDGHTKASSSFWY
ncbi:uncharacterized protein BDR25DRAFT_359669 [Lindgomyces ingoldianus]|uniref:Uncharacterized protein n=1 Tax=Lindgomyces ingoldianus TaxID=673940 RepID=A0ACB6QIG2_9PLEO|nr:uncharacterized protein BDR25DRAFT_359669 [Lindgomyces ingoldianus]KAF2466300.1 hypothetical protein BDR25DRAFT_359669 [Lindgomyces ingoldianus]